MALNSYDNLQKGEDYISTKPVIHIGFLDFDLFEGDEEFYSQYRMLNVKTHREYNGNFGLNVLYLNRIENATEEDCSWRIDCWAKLFKARTWEDIRMIAEKSETMVAAVETMYMKQSDDMAQEILRRKQDEINHQRRMKREREEMEAYIAALRQSKADLERSKADLERSNADLERSKADLERSKADLERSNADLREENVRLKKQLSEK